MPAVRMHEHRHSKRTVMADVCEDLVVIQPALSQVKPSIADDLYVGRDPKALRKAANRRDAQVDAEAPAVIKRSGKAVS